MNVEVRGESVAVWRIAFSTCRLGCPACKNALFELASKYDVYPNLVYWRKQRAKEQIAAGFAGNV